MTQRYSTRQFEILNTIRYLRVLEVPLDAIKSFLDKKDLDQMEDLLQAQQALIVKKQQELALVERKLHHRLQQIADARSSVLEVVTVQTLPEQRMVWMEEPVNVQDPYAIEQSIRKLDASQANIFLGKVGVGLSQEKLTQYHYQDYDCIFLVLDDEDHYAGAVTTLPATTYVSVRFRGSHQEAPRYYHQLMTYILEHHLTITGFSQEMTLIDEGLTTDSTAFVTEIRIPIKEEIL